MASTPPLQYRLDLDVWSPSHAGAAILAALRAEQLEAVVGQHGVPALTYPSAEDRAVLDTGLARTRERAYAFSIGAGIPGAVAVAAPIVGPAGDVLGDIVVASVLRAGLPQEDGRGGLPGPAGRQQRRN